MARNASFDAAVLGCLGPLRANAMRLTRNPDRAEDLVQDTIERALRYAGSYREEDRLVGWLCRIMRNLFNTQQKRGRLFTEDPDDLIAKSIPIPAAQEPAVEWSDMTRALTRLSARMREAVLLAADGESYEEIAARQGINIGTVKSRISRARSQLADQSFPRQEAAE